MPRIFDNIEKGLLPALRETLLVTDRSDFCVGYFNLRGWKAIDDLVDKWSGGPGSQCRLLVGMQKLPQDELRALMALDQDSSALDNQTLLRLKKRLAEEFRNQLTIGVPTSSDEAGLKRLAQQLQGKKVAVKLFLRHTLHAKLYLMFRKDPINPVIGYLGSSNLTLSGLSYQGELNVDVVDQDAATKLSSWFDDRWSDRWCIDITEDLIDVINTSWARDELIPPYQVYVKMAYHLAQEARAGLSEFRIPREFGDRLFDYQVAAVKIAAHHLNKRGGVLIGDVVGLGKTLMATAIAKIFQEDHLTETLIICPKNLTSMWQGYVEEYRLVAKVLPVTMVQKELPDLRRFRVVIVDESHNLRNREGARFRAIQEYIQENESKCILLSATPYNKTFNDLSNQLRLFVADDSNLGIRPEKLIREVGETEFVRQHQCPVHSLSAFEKSTHIDDWRELMRLYMVRRTRSFIKENYAKLDADSGKRYLTLEDGTRSFFPERVPKTVKFDLGGGKDQYSQFFSQDVVDAINMLTLPRYGLANYVDKIAIRKATIDEQKKLQDLSRSGKRLMGFCRTNLFKRLESSGAAFALSLERHALRNAVYLEAIENGWPLPIGTQDSELLDASDEDEDLTGMSGNTGNGPSPLTRVSVASRAKEIYQSYKGAFASRFKWLPVEYFGKSLKKDLVADNEKIVTILEDVGTWTPDEDAKLTALVGLLTQTHKTEKVLVFSQFADTVRYLDKELRARGVTQLGTVTGDDDDPSTYAWRFSPRSNQKTAHVRPSDEYRVLVATDVLSEGQNLQDAAIIVNFDLPWAIIRLIQRAGRVDRIGQKADMILCYSFLPAEGVERLIRLRARVRQRLSENAEVVGTDESFFEDDTTGTGLEDLYNEKAGILDGDSDGEVDLASYAYQIWRNAIDRFPALAKDIPELPSVVFATKSHEEMPNKPNGVLTYMRTGEGNDALAWIDESGRSVTESQYAILRAAECSPDTRALPRSDQHHDLVQKGVSHLVTAEQSIGGQLGRPSGARFRTYERLKQYADKSKGTLFEASPALLKAIEEIYRFPLRQPTTDMLNRQLRSGISDDKLAELVVTLREEDRLCVVQEEGPSREPQIICSMGLVSGARL